MFVILLLGSFRHGAQWTFIARSTLHWFFVMVNDGRRAATQSLRYRNNYSSRFRSIVGQMLTFLVVVVGCVYFRSEAFDAANNLMSGLAESSGISFQRLLPVTDLNLQGSVTSLVLVSDIAFMMPNTHEFSGRRKKSRGKESVTHVSVLAVRPEWSPSKLPKDSTRTNPRIP